MNTLIKLSTRADRKRSQGNEKPASEEERMTKN